VLTGTVFQMETPDIDCLSLRARYLVRLVRSSRAGPSRHLSLLCRLISGHAAARAAVLGAKGEHALLAFLCSAEAGAALGDVGLELACSMVATALMTAIAKRMHAGVAARAANTPAAPSLPSSPLAMTTAPGSSRPRAPGARTRSQPKAAAWEGEDLKMEVGEVVRLVQQFAGAHARSLLPATTKTASSRDGRLLSAAPSIHERALAAQALLKETRDEAWVAAARSTQVGEVLCKVAEHHLEACVLSERPQDYKHSKQLALSLMLLQRMLVVLGGPSPPPPAPAHSPPGAPCCDAIIARQPLKRILQVLVAISDDVVTGPARAFLLALSATDAGALRLLKDGVVHILAELLRADSAWATDASFSAASVDLLKVVHNLAAASASSRAASVAWEVSAAAAVGAVGASHADAGNGSEIARQFSPVLVEALAKFLAKGDRSASRTACVVLLQVVANIRGAERHRFARCVGGLVRLLGAEDPDRRAASLKALTLLLVDSECLQGFLLQDGCRAVLDACCQAVREYVGVLGAAGARGSSGSTGASSAQDARQLAAAVPAAAALAMVAHEGALCLLQAGKYERGAVALVELGAPQQIAQALAGVSSSAAAVAAEEAPQRLDVCCALGDALFALLRHPPARRRFWAAVETDLSQVDRVISDDAGATSPAAAAMLLNVEASLRACAEELSLTMATLASIASSLELVRRQTAPPTQRRALGASTASNHLLDAAGVGEGGGEYGKDRVRAGKSGKARSRRRVLEAMEEMHASVESHIEDLLGTLTTLRLLSHMASARVYVVRAKGGSAVASLCRSLLSLMVRAVDGLQPSDPGRDLHGDHPAAGNNLAASRLGGCAWNTLTVAANLAKEELFIEQLLGHAAGMRAVRLALASPLHWLAAAAAGVVSAMAASAKARHQLLAQGGGFLDTLLLRCRVGEPLHLRNAAVQALHALMRGPEAQQHLHHIRRLLTRDSLLAVGAACLTTTHEKLQRLEAMLGGCDIAQVLASVESERDAHARALEDVPQVSSDLGYPLL